MNSDEIARATVTVPYGKACRVCQGKAWFVTHPDYKALHCVKCEVLKDRGKETVKPVAGFYLDDCLFMVEAYYYQINQDIPYVNIHTILEKLGVDRSILQFALMWDIQYLERRFSSDIKHGYAKEIERLNEIRHFMSSDHMEWAKKCHAELYKFNCYFRRLIKLRSHTEYDTKYPGKDIWESLRTELIYVSVQCRKYIPPIPSFFDKYDTNNDTTYNFDKCTIL